MAHHIAVLCNSGGFRRAGVGQKTFEVPVEETSRVTRIKKNVEVTNTLLGPRWGRLLLYKTSVLWTGGLTTFHQDPPVLLAFQALA